ncbi:hypothetical protein ABIB08_007876 [Bradyrhizobium sp. RT11b]
MTCNLQGHAPRTGNRVGRLDPYLLQLYLCSAERKTDATAH